MSRSLAHPPLVALTHPAESWAVRLGAVASRLIREWRVQRDLHRLEQLDAHALHDIGLAPGALEGAVRHGRRGRPGYSSTAIKPELLRLPSSFTEWR